MSQLWAWNKIQSPSQSKRELGPSKCVHNWSYELQYWQIEFRKIPLIVPSNTYQWIYHTSIRGVLFLCGINSYACNSIHNSSCNNFGKKMRFSSGFFPLRIPDWWQQCISFGAMYRSHSKNRWQISFFHSLVMEMDAQWSPSATYYGGKKACRCSLFIPA